MPALDTQRVALVAGEITRITPRIDAHRVSIGNATADDVRIYGDGTDSANYVVVASGFERVLDTKESRVRFSRFNVAFSLNAIAGGTVVLEWM